MENPIIVPFDLNTARKIKSGEIEGSVLINDIEIEFVYESKNCASPYNLLFVKKDGYGISAIYANTEGCTFADATLELRVEAGAYFKKGDVLTSTKGCSLTEHDIVQLLDDDSREESGSGTYYERECDALFDIDGRGNTERLVARNPKLRNLLEDGEYIPSLGQLNLMAHYMDELNKAFTYVSASPLSSTWYWSSTESSQAVAWYVVFSSGLTGTGNKHIGDMVRTVIDF